MPDPVMANLLVLQDRDVRCDEITQQLDYIPTEIEKSEMRIDAVKERVDAEKKALRELEVRRKDLENQMGSEEEKVFKYKNQQMQVKKNEEYQAFESEIKQAQQRISEFEDQQLEIMMAYEEKEAELEEIKKAADEEIKEFEANINRLKQNRSEFEGELGAAQKARDDARVEVDDKVLKVYDYVRTRIKRPPYVAPVVDQRCEGCHIKASADTISELHKSTGVPRCDNCGRIIYLERY